MRITSNHFRNSSTRNFSVPAREKANFTNLESNKLKITFPLNIPKIDTKQNINYNLNRKFTTDNIFKIRSPLSISNFEKKHPLFKPININIQNININNFNFYNTNLNNSKEERDDSQKKFPIIKNKKLNSFHELEPITQQDKDIQNFCSKFRKIKVIDLKKIKVHQPKELNIKSNIDYEKKPKDMNIEEETIPSNKKIEVCDNNDSFLDELADLFINDNPDKVKRNVPLSQNNVQEVKNIEAQEAKINFEQINLLKGKRPETSYGGLGDRKKSLQIALKSAKYRYSKRKSST